MTTPTFKTTTDYCPFNTALSARLKAALMIAAAAMLACLPAISAAATNKSEAASHTFEAESAEHMGGAAKLVDATASGGLLAAVSSPGQGICFTHLPAASKLAIRYASTNVGTISVAVDDQAPRKINVHSSGAFTSSFLHAITDVAIPAQSTLTISVATNDVAVNVDRILVGDGDLGLPPDIWTLPPLRRIKKVIRPPGLMSRGLFKLECGHEQSGYGQRRVRCVQCHQEGRK